MTRSYLIPLTCAPERKPFEAHASWSNAAARAEECSGCAPAPQPSISRIALDEHELATRWGLSAKTLRRWRQQQLGPVFCKLGSRVTYLLSEIEAFEKRASRYSTSARVAG